MISPIGHGLYGYDGYGYIEREIEDAWSIRDMVSSDKRKKGQPSSSSEKKHKNFTSSVFQG